MIMKKYSMLETLILYEEHKIINRTYPQKTGKEKAKRVNLTTDETNTKLLQGIVRQMREKGFYISKTEQRKIDWPSYTLNQINDVVDTLHFIRNEVDKVHIIKQGRSVGRPPIDAGKLAKSLLFIEAFGFPERKAEGWVYLLGPHLGINKRIDDRVIGKAYKNRNVIAILHQVFKNNNSCDGEMGGDGTGLEGSRKENYESTKKKGRYMTSIVDSREIVQAFDTSGKQECVIMHELVREMVKELKKDVNKLLKKAKLTLDSGFVDRKLAQLIEDSELTPFIFPKKVNVLRSGGFPGWKRMLMSLIKDVQAWLREYHVRSHTESFHSSFKRIYGIITKRSDETVYTQVLARVINNNRRKTSYFELAEI